MTEHEYRDEMHSHATMTLPPLADRRQSLSLQLTLPLAGLSPSRKYVLYHYATLRQ